MPLQKPGLTRMENEVKCDMHDICNLLIGQIRQNVVTAKW